MQLEVGSIVQGKVSGIAKFGAFVDLPDGKVGMVHISEVASVYVNDINEHLKEGQEVKVKVLSIGDDGKISLSIKKAQDNAPKAKRPAGGCSQRRKPAAPVTGPGNFEWTAKKNESSSFEDMMQRYKQSSEEKMSDIKRGFEAKRGTSGRRSGR